jgi:hypothetical protein
MYLMRGFCSKTKLCAIAYDIGLALAFALSLAHSRAAVADETDFLPNEAPLLKMHTISKSQAEASERVRVTEAPAEPKKPEVNSDADFEKEVRDLAVRTALVFTCVPGKFDGQFATQSKYFLSSLIGWSNDLALSSYPKDKVFSDKLKNIFVSAAVERLNGLKTGMGDEPKLKAFIESAAESTAIISKDALENRTIYKKTADISPLVTKALDNLKAAHEVHVAELEKHECINIKAPFWLTPHFNFPSTRESAEHAKVKETKEEPTKEKVDKEKVDKEKVDKEKVDKEKAAKEKVVKETAAESEKKSRRLSSAQAAKNDDHSSSDSESSKVSERPPEIRKFANDEAYFREIDRKYPRSSLINAELPAVNKSDQQDAGYHTYYTSAHHWGRPHIIGNILKASRVLSEKGIYMGVGDINRKPFTPGRPRYYKLGRRWLPTPPDNPTMAFTEGHNSHKDGRAADLRLIGPDGQATQCTYSERCYSEKNTLEMLKALIDTDPFNISVIYINSDSLQDKVAKYIVEVYKRNGRSVSYWGARTLVKSWPHHDNHIHFHWNS